MSQLRYLVNAIKEYQKTVSPKTVVTAGDLLAIAEEASNEAELEAYDSDMRDEEAFRSRPTEG